MRNDDSLATILLVSRLSGEGVQPLKASEYWKLCDELGKPNLLLGQTEAELSSGHGLGPDLSARIVRLLDRATAMAFELERLEQSGINTLTPFDDCYPARLGKQLGTKAPTLLHTAGDLGLLQGPGVGIVGSRDVTEDGAAVAKAAAERAARLGYVLISGGARGVDQLAMNAAFEADGTVVGVLAESLLRKVKTPDVRRAIHEGRAVMCTPYSPDAPFSAGNAMGRNKLVYALSLITLVVASDVDKGGTWSGAVEALKSRSGRVGVWQGPGRGPGNERLIERGATAISSIDDLETALLDPEAASVEPTHAAQPSLFEQVSQGAETEQLSAEPISQEPPPATAASRPDAYSPPLGELDVRPTPTGECWCGCGAKTSEGSFFASGHANRAVARVIKDRYGGNPEFLAAHGYGPSNNGELIDGDSESPN